MIYDMKDSKRPDSSKFTNEFSTFLNQAVQRATKESDITKLEVFAELIKLTPNQLTNIINHRTVPSYGQWLNIVALLREKSPHAYKWLKNQIFGEWENEE
jgi:hypothetical protein